MDSELTHLVELNQLSREETGWARDSPVAEEIGMVSHLGIPLGDSDLTTDL